MKPLKGKIAVVAGASRGAGRGIALGLGDAGATVYVAGRTTRTGPKPPDGAPGTIDDTADEVTARGGVGIPVRADCTVEADVAALFERVQREQGKLDVLANAVWGSGDTFTTTEDWMASWKRPFWDNPVSEWRLMIDAGARAYYLASWHAARMMAAAGKGLIVGVTDNVMGDVSDAKTAGDYQPGMLLWDVGHVCINRLLMAMGIEGKSRNIAVVTVMPGFMRTERVMMNLKSEEMKKMFGLEKSESVEYLGRGVAALAADPDVLEKSGKIVFVADLAKEYGFTDVDGRTIPRFNPFD